MIALQLLQLLLALGRGVQRFGDAYMGSIDLGSTARGLMA